MPECPGCKIIFIGRGALHGHLARTTNIACIEARELAFLSDSDDSDSDHDDFGPNLAGNFPTGGGSFAGDAFGSNYSREDLGYSDDDLSDSQSEIEADSDDEEADPIAHDHAAEVDAQTGDGWEPPRPQKDHTEDSDMDGVPDAETPPPARENRKIAEDSFHEKPIIVKFPGGRAGEPISAERSATTDQQYGDQV
ncbi:hypothetical protein B0H13DRAFT_2305310 [Mycena leptocephala]|nr:hypothetical protein B0H13DRAFT_2305310 [Mycena leptocephala]